MKIKLKFNSISFLGLIIKPKQRYSQPITRAFRLTQATMDVNSIANKDEISDSSVQVWVELRKKKFLIGSLSLAEPNCTIDVDFTDKDEKISLFIIGDYDVHLIGQYLPHADQCQWHITSTVPPQIGPQCSPPTVTMESGTTQTETEINTTISLIEDSADVDEKEICDDKR